MPIQCPVKHEGYIKGNTKCMKSQAKKSDLLFTIHITLYVWDRDTMHDEQRAPLIAFLSFKR